MRAAKWKPEDAKKRIKGTMEWRREFKPELIEPGDVSVEAESGKMSVMISGGLLFANHQLTSQYSIRFR
jgi:hypothetical protein